MSASEDTMQIWESLSDEDEDSRFQDLNDFIEFGFQLKPNNIMGKKSANLTALEALALYDSDSSESTNHIPSDEAPSCYSEDPSLHRCPSDIHDTNLAMNAPEEWHPPSTYEVLEAARKSFSGINPSSNV